jgi:ribose transport system substrate-binding protein
MRLASRYSPRLLTLAVITLGMLVAGLAGAVGSSKASGPTFGVGLKLGATIMTTPVDPASSGPYLVWNKATCSYQKSPVQPRSYKAVLRKVVGTWKIGWMAPEQSEPFSIANNKDIEAQAARAGFKVDFYNDQYPSTTQGIANAKASVLKHDQGDISALEIPTEFPLFNKIVQKQGCIPTVQLYYVNPNVPSMGADWASVGTADGKWLAQYGKQHSINPATTAFVECTNPDNGPSVEIMFNTAPPALEAGGFRLPKANLFKIVCKEANPGSSEAAVVDWFTAHPNFAHIMFNSVDDETMHEVADALKKTGNSAKAITIANGVDPLGQTEIRSGAELASVAFFPEKYGHWDIPLIEDIMAGNPVPSFTATALKVITKANINHYYPHG